MLVAEPHGEGRRALVEARRGRRSRSGGRRGSRRPLEEPARRGSAFVRLEGVVSAADRRRAGRRRRPPRRCSRSPRSCRRAPRGSACRTPSGRGPRRARRGACTARATPGGRPAPPPCPGADRSTCTARTRRDRRPARAGRSTGAAPGGRRRARRARRPASRARRPRPRAGSSRPRWTRACTRRASSAARSPVRGRRGRASRRPRARRPSGPSRPRRAAARTHGRTFASWSSLVTMISSPGPHVRAIERDRCRSSDVAFCPNTISPAIAAEEVGARATRVGDQRVDLLADREDAVGVGGAGAHPRRDGLDRRVDHLRAARRVGPHERPAVGPGTRERGEPRTDARDVERLRGGHGRSLPHPEREGRPRGGALRRMRIRFSAYCRRRAGSRVGPRSDPRGAPAGRCRGSPRRGRRTAP